MNELNLLKAIEKMAHKEKLDVSLFESSEKIPYDVLTVFLGTDAKSRPFVLNITSQKQVIDPKKDSGIFRIPMQIKLPFKIADFSLSQTSNLVSLLNHFLDLPGFEVNEVENEVSYRYVLLADKAGINESLIIGIIGMIKFILDTHAQAIESVATGEITYDELLEKALNI